VGYEKCARLGKDVGVPAKSEADARAASAPGVLRVATLIKLRSRFTALQAAPAAVSAAPGR
jgi:hypothetical protein